MTSATDMAAPTSAHSPLPFDHHAHSYDQDLHQGLRLSGESADYFARLRAQAVARYASAAGVCTSTVLEYGCGTGNNVPYLRTALACNRLIGLDISPGVLDVARAKHTDDRTAFSLVDDFHEPECADIVYLNGVLHHVPANRHAAELARIFRLLRPGGLLALFENNPLNPGTHLVMRRIPFDRDAEMINPFRMKALVRAAGFNAASLRFHFFFPRLLRALRGCEPHLQRVPLGAQYCVLARRA